MLPKMSLPKADRPTMPDGYRIRKSRAGLLSWERIEERMSTSSNYWIGSSRPDGRPHVMPVWGVWIERMFYFSTDRKSRKGRNLLHNPAVVVHLESGDDVVIVEGMATEVKDRARLAAIDDAYHAKYRMRVLEMPGPPLFFQVTPRTVFSWYEKNFNTSATRWEFAQ
jgi:nitroimidazol reductase NimA-like FMN-containing flavoprotein (pyridoxamine 5'-phosphate oxidase superfamily)